MIGDSSGAVYDSPIHHALGLHTDFAEDSPDKDPSSVVAYDDDKSPENNWNELSPDDKAKTQNSWTTSPGNVMTYDQVKKDSQGAGILFFQDYQHQDFIERLKREYDYEHYKDEEGNQFLVPKPKAPLVGGLEGMTKLAGDVPTPDTPESNPFEVAAARTKQSVKPEGGRQEGLLTKIPEAMALDMVGKGVKSLKDIPDFVNEMMARYPGQDFSEAEVGRAFNMATWLAGQPGTAGKSQVNMGIPLMDRLRSSITNPVTIKRAAIQYEGKAYEGITHYDAAAKAAKITGKTEDEVFDHIYAEEGREGFTTVEGKFITRDEAKTLLGKDKEPGSENTPFTGISEKDLKEYAKRLKPSYNLRKKDERKTFYEHLDRLKSLHKIESE